MGSTTPEGVVTIERAGLPAVKTKFGRVADPPNT